MNERVSPDVWDEGIKQASSLADEFLLSSVGPPESPPLSAASCRKMSSDPVSALRTVAIHVLTRIAYGRETPSNSSLSSNDTSKDLSYTDAIIACTEQLLAVAFVPAKVLRLPFMPQPLQRLGKALMELPRLTSATLEQERRQILSAAYATNQTTPGTIMRTLVHLSDQAKEQDLADDSFSASSPDQHTTGNTISAAKSYLTEAEIAGNLFIFTAAGFETTSNTLSYAIALLAAYPKWQSWIQEEIDLTLGARGDNQEEARFLQNYATIFPKSTRCLALMVHSTRLTFLISHDFMS